jgi:hypothetical protein
MIPRGNVNERSWGSLGCFIIVNEILLISLWSFIFNNKFLSSELKPYVIYCIIFSVLYSIVSVLFFTYGAIFILFGSGSVLGIPSLILKLGNVIWSLTIWNLIKDYESIVKGVFYYTFISSLIISFVSLIAVITIIIKELKDHYASKLALKKYYESQTPEGKEKQKQKREMEEQQYKNQQQYQKQKIAAYVEKQHEYEKRKEEIDRMQKQINKYEERTKLCEQLGKQVMNVDSKV